MINRGTTSTPFPISRAISGTMLPRGERWRSMVPLRLVGGKSTGLSVATLARRPLGPAIGEVWPRFVMFRDALQRRDDVLRCNITEAFSHPWKIEKRPFSFLSRFIEMKEEEKKEKKIHSLLRNKRQCRWNRLTLINYYSLVSRSCKKRLNDISVEYLSTKLPILIKSLTRRINETLGQRKREANRLNTLFSLFRRNIFTLASMQSVDEHETYEQRSSS